MTRKGQALPQSDVEVPNPIKPGNSVDFNEPRGRKDRRGNSADRKIAVKRCRRKADRRKVHSFNGDWWLHRDY